MLPSAPVRARVELGPTFGAAAALAAAAVAFGALFLGRGTALGSLVWIGGAALLLAAVLVFRAPAPAPEASAFVGLLAALAVWCGFTTLWSVSPEDSWQYTNRTVVYVAFALAGALLAGQVPRPAEWIARGATVLLAALLGWALLAKCVPSLYSDYGRVARLRAPLDYWNELALLAAVAVPLGLWLASRRQALGAVLLYGAGVTVLLTYSRFGVALACAAVAAWIVLAEERRAESIVVVLVAGALAAAVFGGALGLPGITKDGQPHAVRAHDGWIFALVVLGGALATAGLASRVRLADAWRPRIERAAAVAGGAIVLAAVVVAIVFAHRLWHAFANPVSSQISSTTGRLGSVSSSNRWRWWQEAWQAFVHHPGGGTGAGTFQFTDLMLRQTSLVTTTEPHDVPLQFLSETGIVGFLLFLGAAVAGIAGVTRARARARGSERAAVTALAIGAAAFLAHLVVDVDWDYVATCGPLLFVVGALVARSRVSDTGGVRHLTLGFASLVVALAAVYSLAAPYLAQRQLASAATLPQVKRAHAFDPLSTDVLTEWAAFESVTDPARAAQLYRDAVSLEPENATVWFEYGDFLWDEHAWEQAYLAYSRSWKYDKFGPAGVPCGRLDQARHKALGVWPPSCPGGRSAAKP
jgi:O-antigen ligase